LQCSAGVYFSHYECQGHQARVAGVARLIRKRFPQGNLFFIQAGRPYGVDGLKARGKVYDLPLSFTGRACFRQEAIPPGPLQAARRAAAILRIISREQSGLFITETFPFGRRECAPELGPVLKALQKKDVPLAAVAGYPLLTGAPAGWRDPLMAFYDRAFIFSPPAERDYLAAFYPAGAARRAYVNFFKEQAHRISFAGYLDPRDTAVAEIPRTDGKVRVAVVRGGGAYYLSLIVEALKAGDLLGDAFALTVLAGPSTTDKEWALFNTILKRKKVPNTVLVRSLEDYEGLIARSDVCVSPAPYHTSLALLKHRKRAVLVPFEGYGNGQRFVEQPARAMLLQDHIRSQVVPYTNMSAATLSAAVRRALKTDMKGIRVPSSWFAGADMFSAWLSRM